MPEPYDYSSAFAGLQAPGDSFLSGIKNGYAITDMQTQRAQQARDLAIQQQKRAVIQTLANNPNASADDYAKAAILVPELHAQFKQAWDTKSAAQAQNDLRRMTEWSAAIQSGQPKIASDGMRSQADAIENTAGGPTPESKALRAKADQVDANPNSANFILKSMIAANPNGKAAIDGIVALGGEQRAQDLAPAAVRKANADAGTAESDHEIKNLGIVAQTAGSLAKPGVKPEQAITMFKSLEARGVIPKGGAQGYIDGMPTDAKDLPDYLKQVQTQGVTAGDQMKYTTPDANAQLSADTQVKTTGMNNRTQLAVQDRIDSREENKGGNVDQKQVENVAQLIATGRMAPLGAMAMRTPYGQAVMSRVAEINPEYRAQDFGTSSKAEKDFATGKNGNAVRSFNVGLSHLDTLGQLADAMGNGDTPAINRLGNYFATQTGKEAPVKFEAAKKVVTDEIVKAIVGAGGTGHDREEAAKTVSAANSPAQLRGVINTYKELMVGQLAGLDQQYRTTTGRDDFHKYLSPQAVALYGKHSGAPATPPASSASSLPAGWTVKVH
jgi:hypothetical protein